MSTSWTADRIRAYLFARLDDASLAEAEERLLVDDEFARDVEIVETELVDKYVAGQLDEVDRLALERLVVERPRLRDRVAFAVALAARTRGQASSPSKRPVAWLSAAAAVALLSAGAWWVSRTVAPPPADSTTAATRPGAPTPSPAPPTSTSPPTAGSGQSPVAPPAAPAVFAVLLPNGVTRGTEPVVVTIPPGTARVLFRVPLTEGDVFPSYRLTLRDASDRVVARADRLRPTRERELRLVTATTVLPARAELHVEGLEDGGGPVDLAFLPLDIRR